MNKIEIKYQKLNYEELEFINTMCSFITRYPILWFEFYDGIIANRTCTTFQDSVNKNGQEEKVVIFQLNLLNRNFRNVYRHVIDEMSKTKIIKRKMKTYEFEIIYYESPIFKSFLLNGKWLNYIIAYALKDVYLEKAQANPILIINNKEYEIDDICFANNKMYIFKCVDSISTNYIDFVNLISLSNDIIPIVIYVKDINLYSKIRYVKYTSNFYIFKNQLLKQIK